MRFGIDFGTTRTVVAAVDRGNYPVVNFPDKFGDPHEFIPSVVALNGDEIVAGWEALALESPTLVRSFKRLLTSSKVTAGTPLRMGEATRTIGQVMEAFATAVVK